ncbi:ABC transporter ATP-binding protein [Ottowia sp.]|uniref:ABC transporter ATP-binding protein n=1 Tax=Ottowia sp. TaxID=1898956 RepID=UPI0025F74BB6|nr:ABC transporter ATP-binding protein [Ottowia sp.]MBK6616781.1 ABC transporter ATP-binding protein [Ottowia sp.]
MQIRVSNPIEPQPRLSERQSVPSDTSSISHVAHQVFANTHAKEIGSTVLDVSGVTLEYRTNKKVVTATKRVSFSVSKSDRYVLLGPSGCGKSTLLKSIAGYIPPVEGEIRLNGEKITRPGPDRIVVFQEFDQLLPWKTVLGNIVFSLIVGKRLPPKIAEEVARRYIDKVRLTKFADSYPHTLSGGMKQRVSIARGMAMEPSVLLMDEPFAALDELTRVHMQDELLRLWSDTKMTIIFVTHSIPEAVKIGNKILLLSPHPGQVRAEVTSNGDDTPGLDGLKLSEKIHAELFSAGKPIEQLMGQENE